MIFFTKLTFLKKHAKLARSILTFSFMLSMGAASQFQMPTTPSEFNQVMLKVNSNMELLSSRGLEQKLVQYGYCREIDFIANHISPDLIERCLKGALGLIDRGLIDSSGVDVDLLRFSFTVFSNADTFTKYQFTREIKNIAEGNEPSIGLEAAKQESDRRAAEEKKRQEMQAAQAAEARARQEESDRRAMEEQARRAAEEQKRQEMQAAQAAEANRLAQIENDQINQIKAILNAGLQRLAAAEKIGEIFKNASNKLNLYNKLRENETRERASTLEKAYILYSN